MSLPSVFDPQCSLLSAQSAWPSVWFMTALFHWYPQGNSGLTACWPESAVWDTWMWGGCWGCVYSVATHLLNKHRNCAEMTLFQEKQGSYSPVQTQGFISTLVLNWTNWNLLSLFIITHIYLVLSLSMNLIYISLMEKRQRRADRK